MKLGNIIEWERKTGQPVYELNGRVIRPISRILNVWWRPFGGGVWNCPVAIEVEENGSVREIPIVNINFWAQIGISLITILTALFIGMARKSRS